MKNFLLFILLSLLIALSTSTQSATNLADTQAEDVRIRRDIEEKLDWRNRLPSQLDDVPDAERMLLGGLNESILLRQKTGERFGLFESSGGAKAIEFRLHKMSRLTERFAVYNSQICDKGVSVKAEQATPDFVLYTMSCVSTKYGVTHAPYLFDYLSRNLYILEPPKHYDTVTNKPPKLALKDKIYSMHWRVKLEAENHSTLYTRKFKISNSGNGKFLIQELESDEGEISEIQPVDKLPNSSGYDLPKFIEGRK